MCKFTFFFQTLFKRNKILKNSFLIALDPLFFKFCYMFSVSLHVFIYSHDENNYGSRYFLVQVKGACFYV